MLQGKKIILGVTGSIAAFKAATLVRLFVKEGAEVQVVMSKSAVDFITPLTLSTLSKRPVLIEPFKTDNGSWNSHVDWALWADLIVYAPLTGNSMAKMANGQADNLLLAIYMAARCPVFFAPAMDVDMFEHPATQKNIGVIQGYGNILIPPSFGELASGLIGQGRMDEPENIVAFLKNHLKKKSPLEGKTALVTAGPTYERLDPVRFIGNFSSGKMGYAIAESLAENGAIVKLISGPVNLKTKHSSIEVVLIESADEMLKACLTYAVDAEILVMSAAVADYRPSGISAEKIKKNTSSLSIDLEPTTDILATLGKIKSDHQVLVGFALETNDEKQHALKKLESKNLDFIVLNSLQDPGAGFGYDTNKIAILEPGGKETNFDLKPKKEVASDIVNKIIDLLQQQQQ
jgi:phosphopantothenoylcysteine decarboxylase/phosphopantothenate--cysteine ligase